MFVDARLAARIDRVESRIAKAVAEPIAGARIVEVDGGASVFVRVGSPMNKIMGIGFDGPVALDEAERIWEEPVRIGLATLASPAFAASLTAYQLVGFENVLVRAIGEMPAPQHEVEIGDEAAWMRILVDGFAAEDGTGAQVDHFSREALEQVMRDFAGARGFARYVCRVAGEPVGAATMRIEDGIALLAGAATLPAARRRGVQGALLAARLRDARAAGCELAVITTAPGSLSEANATRSGFQLGYARAILQRAERA